MYADGKGVATNQTKASEHFLIAAEKGDPRAQAEAGMRCLEGVGVDKDPGKGLVLLEQAAEREDPMALYNLATLQEKQDRPEQREQTLLYYTRAAELGVLPAQIKLIDLYSDDSWNPPKTHELLKWTHAAAEQGNLSSQYNLAMMHLGRDALVTHPDPQPEEAARWLRMAASQGSVPSMIMLANLLLDNSGPALDPSEAAEWFLKASKSGNLTAQFNLGVLHESGLGVEQDWVKAAKWYDHAANQGHAEAQWNLALLYEQGKGVPQSDAMALKWFERSAEQGLADACLALATFYLEGNLVAQNKRTAEYWLQKAIDGGCEQALEPLEALKQIQKGTDSTESKSSTEPSDATQPIDSIDPTPLDAETSSSDAEEILSP